MTTDIRRIMIESMMNKIIRDAKKSPKRTVRNLIDMGLNFTKGRFQKKFLTYAQGMLQNQNSAYYELAENIFLNVDKDLLINFGMNLGYNGCTKGAKKIRKIEEEKGFNIPWSLSVIIDEKKLELHPETYSKIIEQGMDLGIYVYLLYLPEGNPEILPELLEKYPERAFAVFLKDSRITDEFARRIRQLKTAMVSVCPDENAAENCRILRAENVLFAVYYSYREAEKDYILSEDWFLKIMELRPHFIFLKADPSCSSQIQDEVYERVLDVRIKQQSQAVFCIELVRDMWKIDEIVSDDAYVIGFEADGSLRMYGSECNGDSYNIFESSLEDILRAAAGKEK